MLAVQAPQDSGFFRNLEHPQVGILPSGRKFERPLGNHNDGPRDSRKISGLLTFRIILNQFTNFLPNHRPLKGGFTPPNPFLQQLPVDGGGLTGFPPFFLLNGRIIQHLKFDQLLDVSGCERSLIELYSKLSYLMGWDSNHDQPPPPILKVES